MVEVVEEDVNLQEVPLNASVLSVVHGFLIVEEFHVFSQNVQNVDLI